MSDLFIISYCFAASAGLVINYWIGSEYAGKISSGDVFRTIVLSFTPGLNIFVLILYFALWRNIRKDMTLLFPEDHK